MRALGGALLVLAALAAWAAPASAERPLPALAPAENDALTRALADGSLTEAEYALERARSLFRLGSVRREFGEVARPRGRDATLVLRDLALRARELSGEERAQAERLLARPTDGDGPRGDPQGFGYRFPDEATSVCGADMCFHWVERTSDKPPGSDNNPATVPAQVTLTKSVFEHVWAAEIGLGYREPLSDANEPENGGNGKLDVYLVDVGAQRIFGYCATDDFGTVEFALPVYCVVDNDFVELAAGTGKDPDDLLRVTAAHEFFHAVQAAYDFFEDPWLLEGTATNMEETVYPRVDDNVTFLSYSPLTKPASPLDRGGFGNSEYGSWIFWRYLEEKVYNGNPAVIRRVWERAAAASPTDPDDYSLHALSRVLRAGGRDLAEEFSRFGVANRRRAYADGSLYPRTPTHGIFRIGSQRRSTGWISRRLDHLTARYFSFRPGRNVPGSAKLKVKVDVHPRGGRARLIVRYKNGSVRVRGYEHTASVLGSRQVDFGRGVVRRVDLVLTNGSSRTRCWRDLGSPPFYSCFGVPKDDRRSYSFRAKLRR